MTATIDDPIRLEVFRNYLQGAAEEAWEAFRRSAYSLSIKERGDCSTAIFTWDGHTLAVPHLGVPLHQGSLDGLVRELLRRYPARDIAPGDMFVTNDPYTGGSTHSMDYCLAAPVFSDDGELLAFVTNVGHHEDVGGRVAGSIAVDNETIYEEGVLIPLVRIRREGRLLPEVVDIISHNSRMRDNRLGDLRAHIAGNLVGVRRLEQLARTHGADGFRRYCMGVIEYSERRLRALLETLPDGEWQAVDYLDGDGVGSRPLRLSLVLRKHGDAMELDWSGAPPQMRSARNIPRGAVMSTCFSVIRGLLDAGLHMNAGVQRVVRLRTRPGTCLDPAFPAAVSDRATSCPVLADMTANCLGQMLPERALAALGAFQQWNLDGRDPETGHTWTNFETMAGGMGATPFADGMDAVRGWPSGSMNPPIEAFEQEVPVVFRRYELRCDSGGPGRFRGGMGICRDMELRGERVRATSCSMRQVVRPPGLHGGHAGIAGRFVLNPGTEDERVLPPLFTNLAVAQGTVLRCETPGGGGVGDPRERERRRVQRDLREGRISAAAAREIYGHAGDGGAPEGGAAEA